MTQGQQDREAAKAFRAQQDAVMLLNIEASRVMATAKTTDEALAGLRAIRDGR